MLFNEDKRIKLPVPFLQDKTVLYVDSRIGTSHFYIEDNAEELAERFKDAGYTFLFIPDLVDNLPLGVLHYLFPGQNDILLAENLYQNIQDIAKLGDKTGFLYKQDGLVYFRVIPESPDSAIEEAIDDLIAYLDHVPETELGEIRFRKSKPISYSREKREIDEAYDSLGLNEPEADIRFSILADEEQLGPRAQQILAAWEKIERDFGITIDDLDVLLSYRIKLSRLNITTSNHIYLPDIEGKPEVKLDDLTKALYFFYLLHPDGASFKELQDYENEIYRIYMGITGRDDIEGIRKSVSALVAPYSDGRNSCVSRIKKAFRDIVGDRIARFYYIDGKYGETRFVCIDRDLVIWDH